MDKLTETIANSILFRDLSPEHRETIRQIAIEKKYEKCQTVFMDGDESDGFYLIMEGQVKIYRMSPDGKEKILHFFAEGEPFGEVAVFSGSRFPASAETLKKSRLAFFPRRDFVRLIQEHPTLTMSMLAVLSRRLRQFADQIEELTLKEVPARLAGYLLYLAAEQECRDCAQLTVSKGQLASLLGTIPETLSRIMARMSGQQLIEVNGREIRLLDQAGLERLAASGRFAEG